MVQPGALDKLAMKKNHFQQKTAAEGDHLTEPLRGSGEGAKGQDSRGFRV